jgi:hypothetical protein
MKELSGKAAICRDRGTIEREYSTRSARGVAIIMLAFAILSFSVTVVILQMTASYTPSGTPSAASTAASAVVAGATPLGAIAGVEE